MFEVLLFKWKKNLPDAFECQIPFLYQNHSLSTRDISSV